jgi:hypothetical protein
MEELPNAYVKGDINFIIDVFSQSYLKNDDGTEDITDNYYVIPVGEEEYIGLHVNEDNFEIANKICDETYEYIMGNTTEIPDAWKITGTINKLKGEYLDYYYDWFKESGYLGTPTQEEIDNVAVPYVLQVDYIGKYDSSTTNLFLFIFCIILLYAITILIKALTGIYINPIKKYLKQNEDRYTFAQIESDFENGKAIDNVKVGRIWTFFFKGNKAQIIKNEDLLWAYRENKVQRLYGFKLYDRKSLVMFTKEKKKYIATMKDIYDIDAVIKILPEVQPHMVTGYSDDLEKCFKKDFNTFINIPYMKEAAEAEMAKATAENKVDKETETSEEFSETQEMNETIKAEDTKEIIKTEDMKENE